jgi:hypothetical protein
VSSTTVLDQDPILAHGQFNLWHDRHARCHNHSDCERQRVTSVAGCIWTWRRVHERVERSGQHDQAGKAGYPSVFTSSCDRTNRTQPWWRLLAGRPRRIPVGRPRWPFAGAVNAAGLAALSFPFVALGRISLRVLPSVSVSARLLGLIAAAGRNTRWFSSIHPAAVLWAPTRAASWPG